MPGVGIHDRVEIPNKGAIGIAIARDQVLVGAPSQIAQEVKIAKLLDLGNPQRVDRQIKQILASLRIELKSGNAPKADGKTSRSSVKAN